MARRRRRGHRQTRQRRATRRMARSSSFRQRGHALACVVEWGAWQPRHFVQSSPFGTLGAMVRCARTESSVQKNTCPWCTPRACLLVLRARRLRQA
eukprot:6370842-Prymnesium_polylepis.1